MMPGLLCTDAAPPARPGTRRRPCPVCDRGPRDTALAVTRKTDGVVVWFCHRCGARGAANDDRRGGVSSAVCRRSDPPAVDSGAAALRDRLWRTSRPLEHGTVAVSYLTQRGCALPSAAADLRWLPELRHPSGWAGPALLALVTDALTGRPLTLHRTWLAPDGCGKAPVEPPRLLFRGLAKAGGVVRLWPDDALTIGLGIAEGIETALAAARAFQPVWACLDAGNLASLPVLSGVEALTVFADHDPAGLAAADRVCAAWRAAGAEARRWLDPRPGADCNDYVNEASHDPR